jgi:tRNA nucleotidyltransferase (CCA-adding enzyme)
MADSLRRKISAALPPAWGERVVVVGGAVRDMLQDKESCDIDVVGALSAEELHEAGFRRVTPKSAAPVFFRHDPDVGKIEVTVIPAMEGLGEELARRDFTVNAIGLAADGTLVDPLRGQDDLRDRILRPCSVRSLQADPLRVFRGFRFETHGWRLGRETEELMRQEDWDRLLAAVPVERFSGEMLKAFGGEFPERFFCRMIEFGAGRIFLPELFRMPETPAGPVEHHPEGDLLTHSLQVLQRVAIRDPGPLSRFCAFFHDIGKLETDPSLFPKHHGHDEAGFAAAQRFCNRLRLPAAYRKALAWTSRLHGKANRWEELRDATRIRTAEQAVTAGIAAILPLVSGADKPGGLPMSNWEETLRVAGMPVAALGVDPARLDAVPAEGRGSFLLQKRVAALRRLRRG